MSSQSTIQKKFAHEAAQKVKAIAEATIGKIVTVSQLPVPDLVDIDACAVETPLGSLYLIVRGPGHISLRTSSEYYDDGVANSVEVNRVEYTFHLSVKAGEDGKWSVPFDQTVTRKKWTTLRNSEASPSARKKLFAAVSAFVESYFQTEEGALCLAEGLANRHRASIRVAVDDYNKSAKALNYAGVKLTGLLGGS